MGEALRVTDIEPEDVQRLWPLVSDMLQSAIDQGVGEYFLEDIYDELQSGRMRLWVAYDEDGVIQTTSVCAVHRRSKTTIATIVLAAGNVFEEWVSLVGFIEEWAKANGADLLMAYTRPGIAKALKTYGFTVRNVVSKPLIRHATIH